jgi:hypothetical protein
MSQFLTEIWMSIFEPGANRSVLIATHASFAALQATLFALLVTTRSWHFFFLSGLCAGLWALVRWFVNELEAVKLIEAEAERLRNIREAGGVGGFDGVDREGKEGSRRRNRKINGGEDKGEQEEYGEATGLLE